MNFNLPQPVRVVEDTTAAEDFHRKLRQREAGLNGDLNPGEVVTMELHTAAGERIRVQDVGYYRDTDTLIFQGFDPANNLCQIIAKVQGLQVMFRVITLPEDQPRKRIGFRVYEEPEQDQPDLTEQAAPSVDRQELMSLLANANTATEVAVARGAAESYLASNPSDGDVRTALDQLPYPTGD
ncbi:MAG: hypothetical protein CYG60_21780 [Actinobacteria bacterium]|nr:MAG: hypothetical protein CYG60_21780 [Actinomycetota bacterium]